MWLSLIFVSPDLLALEDVLNAHPSCVIAAQARSFRCLSYVVTKDSVECTADPLLISHQSISSAESIVGRELHAAEVGTAEEMCPGGWNDLQETIRWGFDTLVEGLADIVVRVVRKEIRNRPRISSCSGDSISDHLAQVNGVFWPESADVSPFNAELTGFI